MPVDSTFASAAAPAMIAAAHGTRSQAGTDTVRRLLDVMRAQRPGVAVIEAWVDVRDPDVPAALRSWTGAAVVVPLLLSTGYHVRVDLPAAVEGRDDVVLAQPLGPDPALVDVLARRLREARAAGPSAADARGAADPSAAGSNGTVVLVSAGSSDAAAADDVRRSAELLGAELGEAIRCAALSASPPLLDDVLAPLGPGAHIATYLLAEGFFAERMAQIARRREAAVISAPLGDDPAIAALAWRRYDEALLHAGRRGALDM